MAIRYRIKLTDNERSELERLTRTGKTAAWKCINARILLLCDVSEGKKHWTMAEIAESQGITTRKIEHLKRRFVERGLEGAIERKKRETPPRQIQYDGAFDARLTKLACSPAPQGHARWTIRLLADKVVELNISPHCSPVAVWRSLKKTSCSLTAASTGRFRPSKAVHL